MSPEMFAQQLARRKFTGRGDRIKVVKLYTESSLHMLRGLTDMSLKEMKLEQNFATQLAASIRLCQGLETLDLSRMEMDDAGAAAMATLYCCCT